MKININIDPRFEEAEIIINSACIDEQLKKAIASLRVLDAKLTGTKNGRTYILDASNILYIDTADKRTFLYTDTDVYESSLRLYELEEFLPPDDFFRAGKSCIINFSRIKSLKSDIGGRMIVTMENGESLIVSRQYTAFVKSKLRRYDR